MRPGSGTSQTGSGIRRDPARDVHNEVVADIPVAGDGEHVGVAVFVGGVGVFVVDLCRVEAGLVHGVEEFGDAPEPPAVDEGVGEFVLDHAGAVDLEVEDVGDHAGEGVGVALLPSATELLAACGGIGDLVGRSHECDFPSGPTVGGGHGAGLDAIPVLTAPKTSFAHRDPTPDARAIDAEVRERFSLGTDGDENAAGNRALYDLDISSLEALRPDVILTQDLCHVCSIDLDTVRGAVADMAQRLGFTPEIVSLNPVTVEGVFDDLMRVGRAVARERAAMDTVVALRERLHLAQEVVPTFMEGPVVGFLEWTDPLFVAGHWTVQLIERAGGRHPWNEGVPRPGSGGAIGPQMAERVAGKSIAVSAEVFAALKPEYIVISPCGYTLEQTRHAAVELAERGTREGWWTDLPAVRKGRVALVDGNQHFNRPGPRLVDAFEWLVGWVQARHERMPKGFPWERFGVD